MKWRQVLTAVLVAIIAGVLASAIVVASERFFDTRTDALKDEIIRLRRSGQQERSRLQRRITQLIKALEEAGVGVPKEPRGEARAAERGSSPRTSAPPSRSQGPAQRPAPAPRPDPSTPRPSPSPTCPVPLVLDRCVLP